MVLLAARQQSFEVAEPPLPDRTKTRCAARSTFRNSILFCACVLFLTLSKKQYAESVCDAL